MSYTAQVERLTDILEAIQPLHLAHWQETEGYRHGVPFNPDYRRAMDYELRGMYRLYTLRYEGELVGNCAVYLTTSMHTQKKVASEDTLFILKEHRGKVTRWFHDQVEQSLRDEGVTEIRVTVKLGNKAGKLLQRWGYTPVAMELVKVYGESHVL